MKKIVMLVMLFFQVLLVSAYGAYHHGGDTDSDIALQAYPAIEGTKLDSCALCHTGGEYEKKPGVVVELGSCQWCHYSYGYNGEGDIASTMNEYGEEYTIHGKNLNAFAEIDQLDSDQDGFSNAEEIGALRYPGNENDDPTKVPAPFRVVSMDELANLVPHTQFMLMNTHKSGDFYAEYTGVTLADLLDDSGVLDSATGLPAFAPDGFAQYHPMEPDEDPLLYHIYGEYPEATFYYDTEANESLTEYGWCDYSSPASAGWTAGEGIQVDNGLQVLIAYARDGVFLEQGHLTESNKLDGEGPFRVVPPQKLPGPPDQSVKSDNQDVIWPFDDDADHNAGFSSRSATILRVEPLPEGTTDVDTLEAGWNYVDEGKILIYGAIDPYNTIMAKLDELQQAVGEMPASDFKFLPAKRIITKHVNIMKYHLQSGRKRPVERYLDKLAAKVDGCVESGEPDKNDWLVECQSQVAVYWALHELNVLMTIEKQISFD